jgi:acyl transferase domain-containing protein/acyl carrier protein/NAD(P)-dependent dehydrogenase (short-subunit alcohol dehydrogenase family)
MRDSAERAVAIVGVGAVLPGAPNARKFWQNIREGVYSITEVQPSRWDPALYYDADPKVPDKTYSKIGGWVRDWEWDPLKWRMPIPPRVGQAMDLTQKWAIITVREALTDYGYPGRPLDAERTAVIFGNAMAGDTHLYSAARVLYAEYGQVLLRTPGFAGLPESTRQAILGQLSAGVGKRMPEITEDTMPGELANIIAGRIAALWDFKGPNFVADAACASTMAALMAAVGGLVEKDYDAVLTGGIDANMSPSTFVKFCKIGALSATGSRPYASGADGFIMGEGAVAFLMKRLSDAERDGDRIYAVIRGLGGSSDGRGKGITAPNPIGQKLSVRRAWNNAGVTPCAGDLMEGHGTSTVVGDVVEVQSLSEVFAEYGLPPGSVALGSVKSNIGHLKGAAGAAGILKAMFALHDKVLPPSANFQKPNPDIDFTRSPFYVNTSLKPWDVARDAVRHAGVSAFGFGGTNFHVVLEEYIPGRIASEAKLRMSVPAVDYRPGKQEAKTPLRGALLIGSDSEAGVIARLKKVLLEAEAGKAPAPAPPAQSDLRAQVRLAIDYADAPELADKCGKALKAFEENQAGRWKALRPKGIFLGSGPAPKVAFLFAGQGSQYVNMLKFLREKESIIAETFATADRVMFPLIGKKLSDCIYLDKADEQALARAEQDLKQTAITQPAVLATETALARILGAYGIFPDMVMGHSLGEYGALVASGAISFEEALRAVSARGTEMTKCAFDDNGIMAAVFGPIDEVEKILLTIEGYVVIANINSTKEAVIGGATAAVEKAMEALRAAGYRAQQLQVSHAFHTKIVAPASDSLAQVLRGMNLQPPTTRIIANVTGTFYPMGPGVVPEMIDLLGKQVASPVQFVKGLNTLYEAGARIFVEVGPKRVLYGFVEDVLGDRDGVVPLFTNHPRIGEAASVNLALCGLYAAGLGSGVAPADVSAQYVPATQSSSPLPTVIRESAPIPAPKPAPLAPAPRGAMPLPAAGSAQDSDRYVQLGHIFADFLERGFQVYSGSRPSKAPARIFITGAALGLPGVDRIFDDSNISRILRGGQFISQVPMHLRHAMMEKNITRLVKTESGEGRFESIESLQDVIKLAARARDLDLVRDFGFPEDRLAALDHVTKLAIGAGIDALRDAGIPLVMRYKTTTKGTQLPDRWGLPDAMRDDTGVLFTSAFPGYDSYEEIISGFWKDRIRRERLNELIGLRARAMELGGAGNGLAKELDQRIADLRAEIDKNPYVFDRRFLFRVLSMGHSQFAEYIGARGPNTSTNAACASGTQAVAIASDWIQAGRCRRVIILSADDITSENLMGWFGSGFLASGAAATDDVVEEAATPFDRRRHGLIIGMGASAMILESQESAQERGLQPICEVLGSVAANSAYHGTRLDVSHICQVMEKLISDAEAQWGINRFEIAPQTVFVSHETYTPARGGSASAEVFALRYVFKEAADKIVVANTKGATGHPMAVGVEDVVGVKILETGIVPPVPNFKEVDPELGVLNLSKGGAYPVQYALRLGAGFGSQICMTLSRWVPTADGQRRSPETLGFDYRITDAQTWRNWMKQISGSDAPELEVAQRTLRIKDQGMAAFAASAPAPVKMAAAAQAVGAPGAAMVTAPQPVAELTVGPAPAVAPEPVSRVAVIDPVQVEVMRIISEKTGYPPDMLDMELDLEADLGIDTVKQAEMFAAIRAAYDIPRDDALKLRDFPTLAHAVKFVYDRRPDLTAPAAAAAPVPSVLPPPVAVAPSAATGAVHDEVRDRVMAIIADKTGYPTDMLDPDLDLEADLGIDTVKQAEMFAAIRAAYDIPRDDALKLRDFPTLGHAVQFVYDRRPDLKAALAAPVTVTVHAPMVIKSTPVAAAPLAAAAGDGVKDKVLQIIAEKTGYPPDMLDLDLDLEADLGIDTVKQAEMFAAIRAAYDIPRDDALKLRDFPTLKHTIQFVYDRRPDLNPAAAPVPAQAQAPVEAPAAAVAPPSAEAGGDAVREMVLQIIAQKTGYPPDMLDLDLDLEADLGIDTVKQAEMFAAIRAAYDIPRDDALKLRDFPTLKHTIQFVYDRRPDLIPGQGSAHATAVASAPASVTVDGAGQAIVGSFAAAAELPRRVPTPRLRPAFNLCKATGVELNAQSRVVLMADQGGVGKALAGRLEKLGVQVLLIQDAPEAENLLRRIEEWRAQKPVQGVYWLPALDHEGDYSLMDIAAWREATRVRVKLLYAVMRSLYDQVGERGTFLVSATRLGGLHGYDEFGAVSPLGGAVAGFTKALKREKGGMLVKVVDFEPSRKTTALAELLIEETLLDPGAVEIGHKNGHRWTIGLGETALGDPQPELALGKDTVFLVTGAAGSIVSAITADLAVASGGTFHLLDLAPAPDPANPDLKRFAADKEGLKRDIFERLKARGERATPALVEKEMAGLERSYAALVALESVKRAGGEAHYYSVNLLNAAAVAEVMRKVEGTSGRIDVLLHAAGLEISHLLPDKKPGEFDLVFDVKSDGWFNLISNLGTMPLGSAVVFSSIAGRFGNGGQTDYSSANDLLCKMVSNFRSTRPGTRGIAIDWTAWSGIGMAARGSIPTVMKQAGIDMLAPEAGIPFVRRELICGGQGEVVVAQNLGIMLHEFDENGGLDISRTAGEPGLMTCHVLGMGLYSGLTMETTLDPASQPFLYDHKINGIPVLPGVMGIEALAEAARLIYPEWHIGAIEQVSFHSPFKFYRSQPRTVTLRADFAADGNDIVACCKLIGSRTLHGQTEPEVTTHFTAYVRLVKDFAKPETHAAAVEPKNRAKVCAADIYRLYFHGPAYQVIEQSWRSGDELIGLYASNLPANHEPGNLPTLVAPRLIELCFQTAGMWELATKARMGLPYCVDRLSIHKSAEEGQGPLHSVVSPNQDGGFDARVVDKKGNVLLALAGYRTMEVPDPVDDSLLGPLRAAIC